MKKFWYLTEKAGNNLQIYYKLMNDNEVTQYFRTQTKRAGNKKVNLIRALMRNNYNWPIVTKKIYSVPSDRFNYNLGWKEIDEGKMVSFLRCGNPDDTVRSYLFAFFGYNIFSLTNLEREYFKASFSNSKRLVAFYHAIKGECRNRGEGYTYRNFRGRSVLITTNKIKKAMMELFNVDPQEVLYKKTK